MIRPVGTPPPDDVFHLDRPTAFANPWADEWHSTMAHHLLQAFQPCWHRLNPGGFGIPTSNARMPGRTQQPGMHA